MKKKVFCLLIALLMLSMTAMAEEYGWTNREYILGNSGLTLILPDGMIARSPKTQYLLSAQTRNYKITEDDDARRLEVIKCKSDIDTLIKDAETNYDSFQKLLGSGVSGSKGGDGQLKTDKLQKKQAYQHTFSNEISIDEIVIPYAGYFLYSGSKSEKESIQYIISFLVTDPDTDTQYEVDYFTILSGKELERQKQAFAKGTEAVCHNVVIQIAETLFRHE